MNMNICSKEGIYEEYLETVRYLYNSSENMSLMYMFTIFNPALLLIIQTEQAKPKARIRAEKFKHLPRQIIFSIHQAKNFISLTVPERQK